MLKCKWLLTLQRNNSIKVNEYNVIYMSYEKNKRPKF
jgi:hypothetical protein